MRRELYLLMGDGFTDMSRGFRAFCSEDAAREYVAENAEEPDDVEIIAWTSPDDFDVSKVHQILGLVMTLQDYPELSVLYFGNTNMRDTQEVPVVTKEDLEFYASDSVY